MSSSSLHSKISDYITACKENPNALIINDSMRGTPCVLANSLFACEIYLDSGKNEYAILVIPKILHGNCVRDIKCHLKHDCPEIHKVSYKESLQSGINIVSPEDLVAVLESSDGWEGKVCFFYFKGTFPGKTTRLFSSLKKSMNVSKQTVIDSCSNLGFLLKSLEFEGNFYVNDTFKSLREAIVSPNLVDQKKTTYNMTKLKETRPCFVYNQGDEEGSNESSHE